MKTTKQHMVGMAAIVAVLLLLAGCGGGGEDGEDAPANRLPTAAAGEDQTVDAGSPVRLLGSGSDADGAIVGYQWAQTAGTDVSLSNADQASASFVAPQVDMAVTLTFRLTVTDDDGATASDAVSVVVRPAMVSLVSLSGIVRNHFTGAVIAGATVSVAGVDDCVSCTGTTDATGAYAIQINASPGRVTVKVDADDFAPQAVVVNLTEGTGVASADLDSVPVEVAIAELQPTDTIEIENQDHILVRVPANSLVTGSGDAPVGAVKAEATVLDPSDPSVMPGDFMALNSDTGHLQPMESFGAMDVRFEDGTGESLTLSSGQAARIWIPLAMNKDPTTAPATMPLFYWSDERGYWIEDGSASLVEVEPAKWAYVGEVSHFTVWNADVLYESVQVSGCVKDGGDALAAVQVLATGIDYNGESDAATDANGQFGIPVRPNSEVLLEVEGFGWISQTISTGGMDMALSQCLTVNAFRLDVSQLDDPNSPLQ